MEAKAVLKHGCQVDAYVSNVPCYTPAKITCDLMQLLQTNEYPSIRQTTEVWALILCP